MEHLPGYQAVGYSCLGPFAKLQEWNMWFSSPIKQYSSLRCAEGRILLVVIAVKLRLKCLCYIGLTRRMPTCYCYVLCTGRKG